MRKVVTHSFTRLDEEDFRMLVGGELTLGSENLTTEVINPADESVLIAAPVATLADVEGALTASVQAFPAWRATRLEERAAAVRAMAGLLRQHVDDLAYLDAVDTGNSVAAMRGDVLRAADVADYYAGLAPEIKGISLPSPDGRFVFTMREPFGTVARIIPFNHPVMFAASKIVAPLIAGNCVIVKLAPQAPLSGLRLAVLLAKAFPPGVLGILNGGSDIGEALIRDRRVKRIAVTGSVRTGSAIVRASAAHLPTVTLELGGKNPSLVLPDADVDAAVSGAVTAMNLGWQGQSCGSASRLLVHDVLYDEVVKGLETAFASVRVGLPTDPSAQMGPIVSQEQYDKVCGYVAQAISEGARLIYGGQRPAGDEFKKGYWLQPTVFGDVTREMIIAKEEIFGPVLSVMRFSSVDEAIDIANDVEYGLTANIWTRDLNAALSLVPRLEAGYVTVNGHGQHFRGLPFGGFKSSGYGREDCLDELLGFTQVKGVAILSAAKERI